MKEEGSEGGGVMIEGGVKGGGKMGMMRRKREWIGEEGKCMGVDGNEGKSGSGQWRSGKMEWALYKIISTFTGDNQ